MLEGAVRFAAPGIFAAHTVDEYLSGFPAWATDHFGTTSGRFYVTSHVALIAAVTAVAESARRSASRVPKILLGSIAVGFVANGIFHIATTRRFDERSPGLATAITLMIPGGVAIVGELIHRRELGVRDVLIAATGGILLNGAAVASLRADMPTLTR